MTIGKIGSICIPMVKSLSFDELFLLATGFISPSQSTPLRWMVDSDRVE